MIAGFNVTLLTGAALYLMALLFVLRAVRTASSGAGVTTVRPSS